MSKAEINNEVIILRKFVEQARVHIIKKLTRDATKYRNKKGTDAQKAKNARKGERLAAEILSIKKVKKDEITKHILTNNLNLKEVLENQNSTPLDRAMTRIAHHKIFSKKIAEFKSKYPNYLEFMGPGRKKKAISEWKERKKIKKIERAEKIAETKGDDEESEMLHSDDSEDKIQSNSEASDNLINNEENNEEDDNEDDDLKSNSEASDSSINDKENNEEENDIEDVSETKIKKTNKKSNKTKNIVTEEKLEKMIESNSSDTVDDKKKKRKKDDDKSNKSTVKQNVAKIKNNVPKIISKQAIVKKFTEILQEDTSSKDCENEVNVESTNSNIIVEKEVDSFFMTGDEKSYLSVVVPKDKTSTFEDDFNDNDDRGYHKRKFSRQQNDKFFSKVPKFQRNDSNFKSQWEDNKSYKKQNHTNRYDRENKGNFTGTNSRFNGDKAKFAKNDRSAALDNKSVEHLHPSWEAKKKQQEMLKKGFQGKKITFGDDV